MTQLDTIYTFTIYLWTWFTLGLIMQTVKNITITKAPNNQHTNTKNHTPTLPWT